MTDRVITYPGVGVQDTDFLRLGNAYRAAIGQLAAAVFGPVSGSGVAVGFDFLGSTALSLTLSRGTLIGPFGELDHVGIGGLPPDLTPHIPVAFNVDNTTVGPFTVPITAGQVVHHVVCASFLSADTGQQVLFYQNADNPAQVFRGVGNDGQAQPTARTETVALRIVPGVAAAPADAVPPAVLPPSAVPLYTVTVRAGDVQLASDAVVPHSASPFYDGIGFSGVGNPNGYVPGNAAKGGLPPSRYWDAAANTEYYCTQTGSAATAVWMRPSVAATAEAPTPARGIAQINTSGPFKVPPFVKAISVFGRAGGGGGGGGGGTNGGGGGGGGGASGAHSEQVIETTPGETLDLVIGMQGFAGLASANRDATRGGDTVIKRNGNVLWTWSGGGPGLNGPAGTGSLLYGSDNAGGQTGLGAVGEDGFNRGGISVGGRGGDCYGFSGGGIQVVISPDNRLGVAGQTGAGGSGGCGIFAGGEGGSGSMTITWGF